MAAPTFAQRLDAFVTGIASLEAAPANASVTIFDRTYTKRDLKELREHEQYLRSQAAKEARGGRRIQRVVPI